MGEGVVFLSNSDRSESRRLTEILLFLVSGSTEPTKGNELKEFPILTGLKIAVCGNSTWKSRNTGVKLHSFSI